jgi:hypothetical protein
MQINAFDFDGVVSIGIAPSKNDVIITGRTIEESEHVYSILRARNINNAVYFNPISYKDRGDHTIGSRECSGKHKSRILDLFKENGVTIQNFFEDDTIQRDIIKANHPYINLVTIHSDLVKK